MKHKLTTNLPILIGLIVLLVVMPSVLSDYYVTILTILLVNAILVVSFRFILQIGEWNFAHVAIMGWGGYTAAILTTQLGWPFWLALPLGGLASATIALIVSYPLFQVKGIYFFVASFAIGEVGRLCWIRFNNPFGGYTGIGNIPSPTLFAIDFHNINTYYFLTLIITLICIIIMYRLENSRIGNTFKSIAMDDSLAQSMGINLMRYKTMAFVIGSFFAGIAGVLLTYHLQAISGYQYTFTYALNLIVWIIVGGRDTMVGPLIGLTILTGVNQILHKFGEIELYAPLIYGVLLIMVLVFLPQGLASLPQRIRRMRDGKGKEIES